RIVAFLFSFCFFASSVVLRDLHSFPTRRSSDLVVVINALLPGKLSDFFHNSIGGLTPKLEPVFGAVVFHVDGRSNMDFKFTWQDNVFARWLQLIGVDQTHWYHRHTGGKC